MTIRELYLEELSELFEIEQHLLLDLPVMAARATSPALRDALDAHYEQTHTHIERLEQIFVQLEERPRGHAHTMRALIDNAHGRATAIDPGDVLDAALLALARRIEAYEIAVYESAQASGAAAGDEEGVAALALTLVEERDAVRRLDQVTSQPVDSVSSR